jgi:tRNA 2-thiouridine synthesizing protein E
MKNLIFISFLMLAMIFSAQAQNKTITVNGKVLQVDENGFLLNRADWNKDVADYIAKSMDVEMTDAHWEIVYFVREYYDEYKISPSLRILVKAVRKKLGPDKGNNKYLYELFPMGPDCAANKIAGNPMPTGSYCP